MSIIVKASYAKICQKIYFPKIFIIFKDFNIRKYNPLTYGIRP
jgi:hypothetical protein